MSTSSTSCGKWSTLLKKRELLAYYILCKVDDRLWNIGEAVDYLVANLMVERKAAFSILRRLRRLELLVRESELYYRCVGFEKYFDELLKNYVCRKMMRGLR